ncbi:hypothetical protein M7I_5659 [Glarea lozoyensis 74030]|uniref:Uncharacterized protein n=1 Tax=Glarea lozoyensis (strain ATCC 74030 / MF5533) TaxID=1104152 RepID=H0ESH1_GLAL7|nr:hypothetical protein M7I_5659 [Glarea lozoyensis 74030]
MGIAETIDERALVFRYVKRWYGGRNDGEAGLMFARLGMKHM